MDFLDLMISHNNNKICLKKVEANSYLHFDSCHFHKWKENVPFRQYRRIRKKCTLTLTFRKQAQTITEHFKEKGYSEPLLKEVCKNAK